MGVNKTYTFCFYLEKTLCICIIKKNLLTLYREITYAHCESNRKDIS